MPCPVQGAVPAKAWKSPLIPRRCEKIGLVFSLSFRRKPESSLFKALQISWTPVFTGVTAQIQFFHTFPFEGGMGGFKDVFITKGKGHLPELD
jgi:hypothetical protein